ncbi:MAG: hypothetical protein WC655_28985, partial [Candidatus Hydrogenedentales bacterium]
RYGGLRIINLRKLGTGLVPAGVPVTLRMGNVPQVPEFGMTELAITRPITLKQGETRDIGPDDIAQK